MQTRKSLIILLVAGVLTVMGLLIFKSSETSSSVPLPSPNGYDDFVKAGKMLADKTSDYRQLTDEELRKLVTQNAEALHLVRTGLSRECRVPLVYSQMYMDGHMSELSLIKRLAQALNANARLARLEHRYREAVEAHLETMRLGHEATRGGPLIDGLVRIACEAIGSSGLQTLLTNLNAGECRNVINELEIIEKKQESFAEVMKHEREWSRRSFPLYQRIVASLMRFFNLASIKQAEQRTMQKFQTQEQQRRHLLLDLAARAYELEKGQRPTSITDLVPDYLKSIPKDPFTGTNLVYRP